MLSLCFNGPKINPPRALFVFISNTKNVLLEAQAWALVRLSEVNLFLFLSVITKTNPSDNLERNPAGVYTPAQKLLSNGPLGATFICF